ncbi:unnamed protein product [Peniophora sp. CBMAI 1063]|nr:unnamed protein product [Peniophora sp. CBMAI 1063]
MDEATATQTWTSLQTEIESTPGLAAASKEERLQFFLLHRQKACAAATRFTQLYNAQSSLYKAPKDVVRLILEIYVDCHKVAGRITPALELSHICKRFHEICTADVASFWADVPVPNGNAELTALFIKRSLKLDSPYTTNTLTLHFTVPAAFSWSPSEGGYILTHQAAIANVLPHLYRVSAFTFHTTRGMPLRLPEALQAQLWPLLRASPGGLPRLTHFTAVADDFLDDIGQLPELDLSKLESLNLSRCTLHATTLPRGTLKVLRLENCIVRQWADITDALQTLDAMPLLQELKLLVGTKFDISRLDLARLSELRQVRQAAKASALKKVDMSLGTPLTTLSLLSALNIQCDILRIGIQVKTTLLEEHRAEWPELWPFFTESIAHSMRAAVVLDRADLLEDSGDSYVSPRIGVARFWNEDGEELCIAIPQFMSRSGINHQRGSPLADLVRDSAVLRVRQIRSDPMTFATLADGGDRVAIMFNPFPDVVQVTIEGLYVSRGEGTFRYGTSSFLTESFIGTGWFHVLLALPQLQCIILKDLDFLLLPSQSPDAVNPNNEPDVPLLATFWEAMVQSTIERGIIIKILHCVIERGAVQLARDSLMDKGEVIWDEDTGLVDADDADDGNDWESDDY